MGNTAKLLAACTSPRVLVSGSCPDLQLSLNISSRYLEQGEIMNRLCLSQRDQAELGIWSLNSNADPQDKISHVEREGAWEGVSWISAPPDLQQLLAAPSPLWNTYRHHLSASVCACSGQVMQKSADLGHSCHRRAEYCDKEVDLGVSRWIEWGETLEELSEEMYLRQSLFSSAWNFWLSQEETPYTVMVRWNSGTLHFQGSPGSAWLLI